MKIISTKAFDIISKGNKAIRLYLWSSPFSKGEPPHNKRKNIPKGVTNLFIYLCQPKKDSSDLCLLSNGFLNCYRG